MHPAVKFLKIIGNGPHSNRNYTYEEAFALMEALIDGTIFSQAQLGALWLMMRRKTTTQEELMGFLDAWEKSFPPQANTTPSLLIANPFDGKKRSVYLSPLAACSIVKQGIPVIIGGAPDLGPKYGVTEQQLLTHPRIKDLPLTDLPTLWNAHEQYPFYKALTASRNEIGLRSFLHTIEKCVNPFGATHAILTLHHEPYIERFIHIAQTRFQSATLLFGEEGSADLCWKKPTRYIRVNKDVIEEGVIDPQEWQLANLSTARPGGVDNTLTFWKTALTQKDSQEKRWITAQESLLWFALGRPLNSLQ